jgi:hypothetical protein
MRYKPQCQDPRYLGGVDEFDLYVTPNGTFIIRFGSNLHAFIRLGTAPYKAMPPNVEGRIDRISKAERRDVVTRMDAMIRCFAPDLCAK